MQAIASYLPGSHRSLTWAPEMIILFWELLQCNRRFRSFVMETNRAHEFVILLLFNALHNKADPSNQGIVRMCVFVLQTMSVEPAFGERLSTPFRGHDALPQSIRLPDFRDSYADFIIIVSRVRFLHSPHAHDRLVDLQSSHFYEGEA